MCPGALSSSGRWGELRGGALLPLGGTATMVRSTAARPAPVGDVAGSTAMPPARSTWDSHMRRCTVSQEVPHGFILALPSGSDSKPRLCGARSQGDQALGSPEFTTPRHGLRLCGARGQALGHSDHRAAAATFTSHGHLPRGVQSGLSRTQRRRRAGPSQRWSGQRHGSGGRRSPSGHRAA